MDGLPDLRGKVCLLTGVTSGIGRISLGRLAAAGATVLAVARETKRGEAAVTEVRDSGAPGEVQLIVGDLSRPADVRSVAKQALERTDRIDVLINNAAVAKFERETTPDGYEVMFATNHLAPFLLTNLLLDKVKAASGRIVNVASAVHKQVKVIHWDDLQAERTFNPLQTYNATKLMNVLFTAELASRLEGTGVTANSLTPGFLHTGLSREATGGLAFFFAMARPFQKSPRVGADEVEFVATSPTLEGVTGRYFQKHQAVSTSALAQDKKNAERLWQVSADLLGVRT